MLPLVQQYPSTMKYHVVPLLLSTKSPPFVDVEDSHADNGDDTTDPSGNENAHNDNIPPFLPGDMTCPLVMQLIIIANYHLHVRKVGNLRQCV